MGIKFLDVQTFTSSGGTWTPPTDAQFFAFHWGDATSGGDANTNLDSITWTGASDPAQSATSAVAVKATQSNSRHSAIWYLVKPDVSGQGTLTWSGASSSPVLVGHVHITAWKIVHSGTPLLGTATDRDQLGEATVNLNANPNAFVTGAMTVGAFSAGGSASPNAGTTEADETGDVASGYRLSDGAVGWTNSIAVQEATLAAATFSPVAGAQGIITVM